MPTYAGVVTFDDDNVKIVVGLEDDRVRLSAGATEIGDWPLEECSIAETGEGVFTITAENEALSFKPDSPADFAAAIRRSHRTAEPEDGSGDGADANTPGRDVSDAKPLTMGAFYVLCGVTVLLGLWALATLLF